MTQEQLAEKLNVSRQTISKWESDTTMPDVESMVRICQMFELSLDELLLKEEKNVTERTIKITLEDLMEINLYNRRMTLLLVSGLLFLMVSALGIIFVTALSDITCSTQYMLYRYIAVGSYASAPVNFARFLLPSIGTGVIGILLCLWYVIKNRIGKN